jgi:hypothetical protein
VSRARARYQEPVGSKPQRPANPQIDAEQHHRDLEPHPERVNRPRTREQHPLVGVEAVTSEEPAPTLAPGLWDRGAKPDAPWAVQQRSVHPGRP